MADTPRTAKPNPTGTRDVTDTEIGKILGGTPTTLRSAQEKVDRASDRMRSAQEQINRQRAQGKVKRATENMKTAQEMIDAMKKAEQRSFGQLEKIEPPKKK